MDSRLRRYKFSRVLALLSVFFICDNETRDLPHTRLCKTDLCIETDLQGFHSSCTLAAQQPTATIYPIEIPSKSRNQTNAEIFCTFFRENLPNFGLVASRHKLRMQYITYPASRNVLYVDSRSRIQRFIKLEKQGCPTSSRSRPRSAGPEINSDKMMMMLIADSHQRGF
jgi:hypothetical protein